MHPAQTAILVAIQRNDALAAADRRARLEPHHRAVRARTASTPPPGLSGLVLRLARLVTGLGREVTAPAASPAACPAG